MDKATYRDLIYSRYLSIGFQEMNASDYEKIAKSYELNYGDIITLDFNSKILDIGCGMGHFLYYLKKRGYNNFLGIEVGAEQFDYCKKNITERVEKVKDTFEFIASKKNYYDLIVLNDVIEHFNKNDAFKLLETIFLSLKGQGRLIIKTPNMGNPFGNSSFYIDFTHEIGFSEISLPQILKLIGFKNVLCRDEKIYVSSFLKRLIFNVLRKIYLAVLRFIILLDRPGGNYPKIFSKNLIVFADK